MSVVQSALDKALGPSPLCDELCELILSRYAEAHRAYHNITHLEAVLQELSAVDRLSAPCVLAACFHDAIYDPKRHDNEVRSAELARDSLAVFNLSTDTFNTVERMILETTKHQLSPDATADDWAFLDADLSILAAEPATYARYSAAIRQEYSHVPDELYFPVRAQILRQFLARERLYFTAPMHPAREAQARFNLQAEVDDLTS